MAARILTVLSGRDSAAVSGSRSLSFRFGFFLLLESNYLKVLLAGFAPIAFRSLAKGQKPVKADWSRFAPTKAVNKSQ